MPAMTARPKAVDAGRVWRGGPGRATGRVLVVVLALVLGACSSSSTDEDTFVERSVEELYNTAQDAMEAGRFRAAAVAFEEVDRQHPYSQWAVRAQMMAAYAYYMANQYDEAIAAAERFIELHPGHPDVPYAYYVVAVSQYEQISDVGRDQEATRKALDALTELVRRFPDSPYAKDAQLKIDLARDHLAGKEMEIGRFYLKRQAYVAAINRFRTVVETYQTTTHVPEALHRLVEAYLALGVREEAQRAAAVLGYNYPGNVWYERSYALLEEQQLEPLNAQKSWVSRLF